LIGRPFVAGKGALAQRLFDSARIQPFFGKVLINIRWL
jgi:hypothetical protein